MKVEDIITFLKEDEKAKEAILDAFELVGKSDLDTATAKVDELTKAVEDAADNANLIRIYKEQLQSSMVEAVETKAALDSAVSDHRETLNKLNTLSLSVTSKEFKIEDSKLPSDQTLSEIMDTVSSNYEKTVDGAHREKIFGLAKKIEDATGVEDPTKVVGDDKKVEDGDSDVDSFTRNEVSVATRYGEKLKANKKSEAANYLKRMKREGLVADSFDPNTILETLKTK